jgi:hypothetical protein
MYEQCCCLTDLLCALVVLLPARAICQQLSNGGSVHPGHAPLHSTAVLHEQYAAGSQHPVQDEAADAAGEPTLCHLVMCWRSRSVITLSVDWMDIVSQLAL